MANVVNINDVLDGHVILDIECVDRLYLNAYIPNLQVGPQVKRFCEEHLGQPIASPVIIQKIGNTFRRDVNHFAEKHRIPILHLIEARSHPLGRPQARPRPPLSGRRPSKKS